MASDTEDDRRMHLSVDEERSGVKVNWIGLGKKTQEQMEM